MRRCKVGPHGDLDVKRITQQIDNDDIYADFRSKSPMMPSQSKSAHKYALTAFIIII